jgi:hypothetical protein
MNRDVPNSGVPGPVVQIFSPRTNLKLATKLGNPTAFMLEDVARARQNDTTVPLPSLNPYLSNRESGYVSTIGHMRQFKLIEDPVAHEMEYKRRNVWSVGDIRTFLQSMLEGQKNFQKIGEDLPHKTYNEIVFFYHSFKKLMRLKYHLKTCREGMSIIKNTRDFSETVVQTVSTILEPLLKHAAATKLDFNL